MSSSCPRFHFSSQADTFLLLWLPPGYCGNEQASLEPARKSQ